MSHNGTKSASRHYNSMFKLHLFQCRLTVGTRKSIMHVFCRLLDPGRGNDATRGRVRLGDMVERFSYTYVTEYFCDTCCTDSNL